SRGSWSGSSSGASLGERRGADSVGAWLRLPDLHALLRQEPLGVPMLEQTRPECLLPRGEGSLLLPRPSGRARNLVNPLRPEASPGVPGPASQVVNQSIAEGERLTEEDRRSLEAYSVGVITATRFARYREDVRRRL